jgi:hypothetical protein
LPSRLQVVELTVPLVVHEKLAEVELVELAGADEMCTDGRLSRAAAWPTGRRANSAASAASAIAARVVAGLAVRRVRGQR